MFNLMPCLCSQQFRIPNISIRSIVILYAAALLLLFNSSAHAERSSDSNITTQLLSQRLSQPWGMTWLDQNTLFITEKYVSGWIIDVSTSEHTAVTGWPEGINTRNQGGLLDVVADPAFSANKTLYFSYSHQKADNEITTQVASAQLNGSRLVNWKVLFTAAPYSSKTHHYGSRLAFKDRMLFITVGDRGERDRAQNLADSAGKVHRINPDGSIPPDNPFIGQTSATDKPIPPSIYSYGHRNPQGLTIDNQGHVWIHEHGPRGGDELNLIVAGKNYGWPAITYGKEYWGPSIGSERREGMQQPFYTYIPSIAPSGLVRYQSELFTAWQGDFLIGALKERHLNRLSVKDALKYAVSDQKNAADQFTEHRHLMPMNMRVRDIEVGHDGAIYLLTEDPEAALYRLVPKEGYPPGINSK